MTNTVQDLGLKITKKLLKGHSLFSLKNLLENYDGYDYFKYLNFSNKTYTRTKLFSNDLIDIILICWDTDQCSGIHDHPESGCLMKVLRGKITEHVYTNDNNGHYLYKETNILGEGDIGYRQDKYYIHNIVNGDVPSISLHIYSPPNYTPNYY